jgi:hypothetical protein
MEPTTRAALGLMLRAIRAANEGANPLRLAGRCCKAWRKFRCCAAVSFPAIAKWPRGSRSAWASLRLSSKPWASCIARWDGKGVPALKGDAIAPAMQVVSLAQDAVTFLRTGGMDAVKEMARKRSGKAHSPRLSALLLKRADEFLAGLQDEGPGWDELLALEPGVPVRLGGKELDECLRGHRRLRRPQIALAPGTFAPRRRTWLPARRGNCRCRTTRRRGCDGPAGCTTSDAAESVPLSAPR